VEIRVCRKGLIVALPIRFLEQNKGTVSKRARDKGFAGNYQSLFMIQNKTKRMLKSSQSV
jgi:hypothetical protein